MDAGDSPALKHPARSAVAVIGSPPLGHRLGIIDHNSPLLMHAIEMMHRPNASSQGMGVGNRCCDVGFRQQHRLRHSPTPRQMTGHRCGEGTPGAMSRVRLLPAGLENLLLRASPAGKAQELNGLFQVAAGDNHAGRTHLMKPGRSHAHLVEIGDCKSSQGSRLVQVGCNDRG